MPIYKRSGAGIDDDVAVVVEYAFDHGVELARVDLLMAVQQFQLLHL